IVPRTHPKGTYVCMEGPAFSTKAESETYRRLGFDIIGMTAIPEAKLAREAGICYATLAQVTDYDCWHADHDSVTSDMVMANVAANSANATGIIRGLIRWLDRQADCSCRHAVEGAVATEPGRIDAKSRERLAPLLDFVHTSQ
ncbi:MAG: S-methyl-5'-thioadenosine phosphorylase, partial [Chloroflexota bacterium]